MSDERLKLFEKARAKYKKEKENINAISDEDVNLEEDIKENINAISDDEMDNEKKDQEDSKKINKEMKKLCFNIKRKSIIMIARILMRKAMKAERTFFPGKSLKDLDLTWYRINVKIPRSNLGGVKNRKVFKIFNNLYIQCIKDDLDKTIVEMQNKLHKLNNYYTNLGIYSGEHKLGFYERENMLKSVDYYLPDSNDKSDGYLIIDPNGTRYYKAENNTVFTPEILEQPFVTIENIEKKLGIPEKPNVIYKKMVDKYNGKYKLEGLEAERDYINKTKNKTWYLDD